MMPSNEPAAYSPAERAGLKISAAIFATGALALAYACPKILWPEVHKLWNRAIHCDAATLIVQFPPKPMTFCASVKVSLAATLLALRISFILAAYLATALPSVGLGVCSAFIFRESRT